MPNAGLSSFQNTSCVDLQCGLGLGIKMRGSFSNLCLQGGTEGPSYNCVQRGTTQLSRVDAYYTGNDREVQPFQYLPPFDLEFEDS